MLRTAASRSSENKKFVPGSSERDQVACGSLNHEVPNPPSQP